MAIIKRRETQGDQSKIEIKPTGGGLEDQVSARKGEGEEDSAHGPEIDRLVPTLALLVHNTVGSLWMSVSDFTQNASERFRFVTEALAKHEEVRFTIRDELLLVNGELFATDSRYVEVFAKHLSEMGVNNFALLRGMSEHEFIKLLDVLGKSLYEIEALGGFAEALAAADLKNVVVRKVALKEVAEDELVVDKKRVDEEAIERRRKAEEEVLAIFSSDERAATTGESAACMHELAQDPEKMADLIVQATETRHAADISGEETKDNLMVECLERAFHGLMKHPSFKTQKGKKEMKKMLELLEQQLVARIDEAAGANVSEKMCQAIKRMTEGLKTADIAADYTRKIKALEQSEKRILRFIKAQGLEHMKEGELAEKLNEGGLDVSGWHSLLAKSGALEAQMKEREKAGGGAEDSADAVANLAFLLSRLDDRITGHVGDETGGEDQGKPEDPSKLADELKEANRQVNQLVDKTEMKVEDLIQAVTADMDDIEAQEELARKAGEGPRLTRKKIVQTIAEIVQELCQPLSVITCSIDMVTSKVLGETTAEQDEMLKLAVEGAGRIKTLINHLEKISGTPLGLSPDTDILDSAYGAS